MMLAGHRLGHADGGTAQMKHLHKWIERLMNMMEERVDEQTRAKVLEECGRSCLPRSFLRTVQASRQEAENEEEFLKSLSKVWTHFKRDGDRLYAVYEKCYCPLVRSYPGHLSKSFCNCSRGWIKELLEQTLGRPVEVDILSTIARGDDVCRLQIYI
jgi:predicted hydrocarbon binding protein